MSEVPAEGPPSGGPKVAAKAKSTVDRVDVQCNGMPGTLLITTQAIVCKCPTCVTTAGPQGGRVMTPTEFERHSGMQASKKWRRSIKVDLGGVGRFSSISVGRWLEQNGFIIEEKDSKEPSRGASGSAAKASAGQRQRQQQADSDSYSDEEDAGPAGVHPGFPRYPLPGQHNLFSGMMPHPGMMLPPQGLNPFFMSPLQGMFGGGSPFHPAFGARGSMMSARKTRNLQGEQEHEEEDLNHKRIKTSGGLKPPAGPRGTPLPNKQYAADPDLGKGPGKEQEDELMTAAGALELLRAASETRGTASTGNKENSRRPASKRGQEMDEDKAIEDDKEDDAGSEPRGSKVKRGGGGSAGGRQQPSSTPQGQGSHGHSSSDLTDDAEEEEPSGDRYGSNRRGFGHGSHMRGGRMLPPGSHLPFGYPSYPPGFGYDPYVVALAQQQQQQQLLAAAVAMGFPHPLAGGARSGHPHNGKRLHSAGSAADASVPRDSKTAAGRLSVPPETPKGAVGEDGEGAPGGKGDEEGNADEGEDEDDTPLPAHLSMSNSSNINEAFDLNALSFAHQSGGFGLGAFASNPIQQALLTQQLLMQHQLMAAGGHLRTQGGVGSGGMAALREMLAASGRGFGPARGMGGPATARQAKHSRSTEEHS